VFLEESILILLVWDSSTLLKHGEPSPLLQKPIGLYLEPDNSVDEVQKHYILNPVNAKLNPIYHLLALFRAHHILHVCR